MWVFHTRKVKAYGICRILLATHHQGHESFLIFSTSIDKLAGVSCVPNWKHSEPSITISTIQLTSWSRQHIDTLKVPPKGVELTWHPDFDIVYFSIHKLHLPYPELASINNSCLHYCIPGILCCLNSNLLHRSVWLCNPSSLRGLHQLCQHQEMFASDCEYQKHSTQHQPHRKECIINTKTHY